jgi:regulator of protease activity HflC (stomatin/prohibitin superfamily)
MAFFVDLIAFFIIALFFILIVASNIKIVPQASAYVIERLGAYHTTWETGLHFKIPLIDRISLRVNLKEMVVDFPPQPVITKDNVTMKIDTVVYYQITDAKLYTYGVGQPIVAIENLTATTLRNIIGQLELDETLTSRDLINTQMRAILDEATDPWGIKVNRVEVKNILPPVDIQEAMEKQMRAERGRRESILRAEGEKMSSILVAEGKKESSILGAEAEKRSAILRAEAKKESQIREAEGEAEAILKVQQAKADGIEMIKKAGADQAVLMIQSFEALVKVADGQSTKLIIPSELAGVANLVATLKEASSLDKTFPSVENELPTVDNEA